MLIVMRGNLLNRELVEQFARFDYILALRSGCLQRLQRKVPALNSAELEGMAGEIRELHRSRTSLLGRNS
jgi:hypothetical protein